MTIAIGRSIGLAIIEMIGIDTKIWKTLDVSIDISQDKVAAMNFSVAIEKDTFEKLSKQLNSVI